MTFKKQQLFYKKLITTLLTIGGIFTSSHLRVLAELKPDNTLGAEKSVVTKINDLKDIINGGAARGSNLFHSFEKFNVGENRSVYFANPTGIENILTRVTGDNVSNIFGTLGVEGTANLFLINPNGIFFGKDAVLDIRGSFTATTADGIKLGENGLFSATAPATSNLLSVQLGALFVNALKNQQAKIENQGNLITGTDLIFFSSNINSRGILSAPHGKIELTSTVGDVEVNDLTAQSAIVTANQNLNYEKIAIVADENAEIPAINPILSLTAEKQMTGTGNITTTAPGLLVNLQARGNINIKDISSKGGDINITSEDGDIITGILDTTYATPQTTTIDIDHGGTLTIIINPYEDIYGETGLINPDEDIYGGNFTFTSNLTDPITEVKVRLSASNVLSNSNVSLSSPAEYVSLNLIDSTGNNLVNFQDTLLADSASTPISSGSTPFNGTFQPSNPLAQLNKRNPNGSWDLSISSHNNSHTTTTVYKAGDTAPWGIATGTQLIITTSRSLGAGGNVNLKAGGKISTSDINSSSSINAGLINLNAIHDITTGNINASSMSGNGGAISLKTTQGHISTQSLDSSSHSYSGTAGNGGAISLTADGNITTQNLNSSSESFLLGRKANGGAIFLFAGGDISTHNLESFSYSGGKGGNINLNATDGSIYTYNLNSFSQSFESSVDDGGNINLTAVNGSISTQNINSYSYSYFHTGGNGGNINLTATGGNITTENIVSYSRFEGKGGDINLTAIGGDISTQDIESYSSSRYAKGEDSGSIYLTTDGNIYTENINSYSYSYKGENGGKISLNAGGNIKTKNINSSSLSIQGRAGNGGDIYLTSGGDITTQNIDSYSRSYYNFNSPSFSYLRTAGSGGDIFLTSYGSNIFTQSLKSDSITYLGKAGNGGAISLTVPGGDINGIKDEFSQEFPSFYSLSISENGTSGKGGDVALVAKNNITNLEILTLSSSSKSGDVQVQGFDNLSVKNTKITTSNTVTFDFFGEKIILDVSDVGQSGNVNFTSTGNLIFQGSRIESDTRGSDPAGNVNITSPGTVTFNNSSKITSNTSSTGKAGNIQINAKKLTLTNNSELSASTTAEGKAGDITLDTPTLTVANGAEIFATTTGTGDGGTITINADKAVNLGIGVKDSSPILSVETSGAGKAGNIIVNTPSLTVSDTARITATATETATNKDGGGSITLNASKMNLAGIVGVFAETQGQSPAGTLQLNPYENQNTLDLTLFPGSIISASTTASGKGGDLIITAPENINIAGQGKLAVESKGTGDAGNILITSQNLNLSDGVKISASTSGSGKGGNIIVQVKDNITLDGTDTGLFASTELGSIGDSGSIDIDPQTLTIKNGAGIGVNSQGSGEGGDVSVQAGNLILDNQGFISAETASNQGGNINLNIPDLLLFRNNSKITATAGTGGDGGNININTPFIIAFPSENSDITANAFQGDGGKINITTNAIFGLEYQQELTRKSDITASSEFGLAGQVEINTPDIDPTSGLIELPGNLVNAESLLGKDICSYEQRAKKNSFTIIGRGGLPAEVDELISNSPGMVEWANRSSKQGITPVILKQREVNKQEENIHNLVIQEAQGWMINADGKVFLTAETPKVTLQNSGLNHPGCYTNLRINYQAYPITNSQLLSLPTSSGE
ncbi:filamentous hemagglutinin N-terminal domain-containing protein [Anabaena sp. UHCC 0451]|uniref:two-partner secretion domain-containing protein n=1 Tax=Anabaena sp. UHCC 0451 TaxID=2055235 RepID=UPI002B21075E|nr:filamentous hemagglutinin N-terminal domain-containing protein [Anabaena sp. UHCC 0451]MEA5575310.1 filamentous hemagglutinin N-terminal domain-containing protein [Anabaena sp. UHCC 0451]